MKKVRAIVVEYNRGVETGYRKYKSLEKAWMDAEKKNTTDPMCIQKLRFYKVTKVTKKENAVDNIA